VDELPDDGTENDQGNGAHDMEHFPGEVLILDAPVEKRPDVSNIIRNRM